MVLNYDGHYCPPDTDIIHNRPVVGWSMSMAEVLAPGRPAGRSMAPATAVPRSPRLLGPSKTNIRRRIPQRIHDSI